MKRLSTAALVLAASPLLAQQTGVSHPADIVEETPVTQTAPARPVPVVAAPVIVVAPTSAAATANAAYAPIESQDTSPAVTLKRHDLAKFDPDGEIVEEAPQRPDEVPAGTLIRARLKRTIETASTAAETTFTAELTEPVRHMGHVIVPAGAVLEGRITEIHGGRRIRGAAMIHLQAQTLILPDGTRMPLNAAIIDTDQYANTRIDSEGNIVRKDHAKETLAALSLTTGSAAAAGGVIGGVPGALVGAGIGAGVGTVWWLKQDRQTTLPADTLLVMSLTAPLPIKSLVREPEFVRTPAATPSTEAAAPLPKYTQSFVPSN